MTQVEFNKLPGLLLRKQFQDATGLSDRDLDAMTVTCNGFSETEMERVRTAGLIPVLRPTALQRGPNGSAHGKYYKSDAARMGGFKL